MTDELEEIEPCFDCAHRARCRTGLACAAFQSYYGVGGRRWRNFPREPSAKIFEGIFGHGAEREAA